MPLLTELDFFWKDFLQIYHAAGADLPARHFRYTIYTIDGDWGRDA